MKRITILLVIIFLLSACGQSKFNGYLRNGKDNLQQSKYEEAIKQFDLALIEAPSDKDVALLMDRAKKSLNDQKTKEAIVKYEIEFKPILDEYIAVSDNSESIYNSLGLMASLSTIDTLKDIRKKIINLKRSYNSYPDIITANQDIIDSLDCFVHGLEAKNSKDDFRMKQYKSLSDDYVQNYKDKIAKLTGETE